MPRSASQRTGGRNGAMGRLSASGAVIEYLYVPCVRIRHDGTPPGLRRWVRPVPFIKKTAKWIYSARESWNRREAVVSPGCISREQFEANTGPLLFATREAAEGELSRGEPEQAVPTAPVAALLKGLRRAMADAH